MTEASYTAWDDNEYQWPPPEGWYQSSDGKWWPEGYGPPAAVSPEERLEVSLALEESDPPIDGGEQPDVDSQAGDETVAVGESPERPALFNGRVPGPLSSSGPSPNTGPAMEGMLFDSRRVEAPLVDPAPVEELGVTEPPPVEPQGFDGLGPQATVNGDTVYTPPPTAPPPTAPPAAEPELSHAVEQAPETIAVPSDDVALDFATAGTASIPDPQEMLGAAPKGSWRGLLLALIGAIVLVAIGVGVYLALGGDEEPAETAAPAVTGPGSIDEPHPRASGVVLFYPDEDAGADQRWIVEVLEPVRDATVDLGGSDDTTLAATRLRIRNESGAELASVGDLRFNVVDASGAVIVRTDNRCPAAADDLNFDATVPVGSTVEGTVCWAIPTGAGAEEGADLDGLKLGIESPKVQGRIHIALQ